MALLPGGFIVPKEVIINDTIDISKYPADVKWEIEAARFDIHHKGHDAMHLWIFLSIPLGLVLGQVGILIWKRRNYKSYHRASLVGLWLFPMLFCAYSGYTRFIIIWTIFSLMILNIIRLAIAKPMAPTTPRWVYKYFYTIHKLSGVSCILSLIAYVGAIFAPIFAEVKMEDFDAYLDISILFGFYGFYFGMLCRDTSEVVTDKMACSIGYYTQSGLTHRALEEDICAVCAQKILVKDNSQAVVEERFTLTCGHSFHEFCIRGWCIVGKKQTCPYCKEKVDLKRVFYNPWDKPHVLYGDFLDLVRYFVVWQPVIIMAIIVVDRFMLGLE